MPKSAIYFISDAHLGHPASATTEKKLIAFFKSIAPSAEKLFILGDLFDFWFEYREVIPNQHFSVLQALKNLKDQDTEINYITGNHDFWLGNFLTRQIGIKLIGDQTRLVLQHRKILLAHGDGLIRGDYGYRFLKKILRFPLNIHLYRLLHPDLGIPLAKWASGFSRRHNQERSPALHQSFHKKLTEFAFAQLEKDHDEIAIFAHQHEPCYEERQGKVYINLGDWIDHFTYARIQAGEIRLEKFTG